MNSGNEDTHLLPETDNAIRTRTKSKKSVHYSICVILILHNVSTQSGYSVIMEYTFRHISERIQADLTNSSITQSIANKNCSFHSAEAQRESAQWDAYYGYAEYIPGLFVVVFGGIMSDYYGRRFFIILPLLGTFLQYFATLVVVQYNLDIKYFFVGFLLAGITGTRCTLSMALSGVVADITKYDKSRSFTFALLHLYDGIGSIIAHISTGYTLKYLGSVPPCLVSFVLCFFNLFTGLYLPETLGNSKRKTNDDTLCQKVGRFFAFYTSSSNLRDGQVWQFVMCVLALTFVISPFTTRSSVDVLYFLGQPFCFTSEKIGWYDSADDVVSLCISAFVLKLLHFCANDDTIAILSCLSGILSFTIEGFASVWWMLYVGKSRDVTVTGFSLQTNHDTSFPNIHQE